MLTWDAEKRGYLVEKAEDFRGDARPQYTWQVGVGRARPRGPQVSPVRGTVNGGAHDMTEAEPMIVDRHARRRSVRRQDNPITIT